MRLANRTALITGGNSASAFGVLPRTVMVEFTPHPVERSSATETGPQTGHPPRPLGLKRTDHKGMSKKEKSMSNSKGTDTRLPPTSEPRT